MTMDKDFTISLGKWSFPLIQQADFPDDMPRYPNAWFYVSQDYAAEYDDAVNVVLGLLEDCGLYEVTWRAPLEGADAETAMDHLQPYAGFDDPGLFHEHSLHLRYYLQALKNRSFEVQGDCIYSCWAIATSVHFEPGGRVHYLSVDDYPDLRTCPLCGSGDEPVARCEIYEKIYDPLGLELLLQGTIRGRKVRDAFGRNGQGLPHLNGAQARECIKRIASKSGDFGAMTVAKLGFVLIA